MKAGFVCHSQDSEADTLRALSKRQECCWFMQSKQAQRGRVNDASALLLWGSQTWPLWLVHSLWPLAAGLNDP